MAGLSPLGSQFPASVKPGTRPPPSPRALLAGWPHRRGGMWPEQAAPRCGLGSSITQMEARDVE